MAGTVLPHCSALRSDISDYRIYDQLVPFWVYSFRFSCIVAPLSSNTVLRPKYNETVVQHVEVLCVGGNPTDSCGVQEHRSQNLSRFVIQQRDIRWLVEEVVARVAIEGRQRHSW